MDTDNALLARDILAHATDIVALTGAGISTASGIPDFRGPEGVWTKDPHAEMLSTYDTWVSQPDVRRAAWRSRVERRIFDVAPNPGHHALVTLERRGTLDLLVTQNIDGLHQRAGNSADLVVEIHGSARDAVCLRCGDRGPIEAVLDRVRDGEEDPHCRRVIDGALCGGLMKSATISFGQSLVAADLERAQRAAARCEVLLAVGSTLSVYPVAGLVPLAHAQGAQIIIVNGSPTALDDLATVRVDGDITETLPFVVG